MQISKINCSAVSAWCPLNEHPNVIATGSIAGSLTDFSSESKLELFSTELDSIEPKLIGSINSYDRFHKLVWGNPHSNTYSYGLLAGAMVDGSVGIWNPEYIFNQDNDSDSLLVKIESNGPVFKSLAFNPKELHLLAGVGEDPNIYIWNLKDPKQISQSLVSLKTTEQRQIITNLSWNKLYESILATTTQNGSTTIWDIRKQQPLVNFKNPNISYQKRYSSIEWNPEITTQLSVAHEDDSCPVIEIWDLRKTFEPFKILQSNDGHTKGILSLAWCPDDSNFLISAGKDNRTIIWNPNTGEMISELMNSKAWMFDVQWSYRPSIFFMFFT
jgi:protein transport protein SEC31